MRSKSRITGILLFCLFVDPVIGTFAWLHCQKTILQKDVQQQIRDGMDREDLILLKFSKKEVLAELDWEHPGEFRYNHQMYDVVETITLGDTVYYWCWQDHEETQLNRHLEVLAARVLGKDRKIKEKDERLNPSFKSLYCTTAVLRNDQAPRLLPMPLRPATDPYSSLRIRPPTPPPQPKPTSSTIIL